MKTTKEIEQLAKEKCSTQYNGFFGYIQGYTQCQTDMADKKYTEEDMIAFAYQFSSINVADFRKHLKDFNVNLNVKNKQD